MAPSISGNWTKSYIAFVFPNNETQNQRICEYLVVDTKFYQICQMANYLICGKESQRFRISCRHIIILDIGLDALYLCGNSFSILNVTYLKFSYFSKPILIWTPFNQTLLDMYNLFCRSQYWIKKKNVISWTNSPKTIKVKTELMKST